MNAIDFIQIKCEQLAENKIFIGLMMIMVNIGARFIIEELSDELKDKLTIAKLDVDNNRDSAIKQKVMSIPTLILFKDGNPIDQRIGALTKNQLLEFLNQHI